MTAISRAPENQNFLSPISFDFSISHLPHVNFFVQRCNVPGLSLGETIVNYRSLPDIKKPGDKVIYNELSVTFAVDELMYNWLEIHDWMLALGGVRRDESDQFPKHFQEGLDEVTAVLLIHTSHRNASLRLFFEHVFPINLAEIEFDATPQDIDYFVSTVGFAFTNYRVERLIGE